MKQIFYSIIITLLLTSPASAQLIGDLNCNGYAWEVADAVEAARMLVFGCLGTSECPENSDLDGDGFELTIADLFLYINPDTSIYPDYGQHPLSDTIKVESTSASPGESIILPIRIKTIDTLIAYQFLLELENDNLVYDSMTVADEASFNRFELCDEIYGSGYNTLSLDSIVMTPQSEFYHIANLHLTINPETNYPATTRILFSHNPAGAMHTGFSNIPFFFPVMVDGLVTINPVGIDDQDENILPSEISLMAYPNPFNGSTSFEINTSSPGELAIYDIQGRVIREFSVSAGQNQINWDASDYDGNEIKSGIYLAKIKTGSNMNSIKLVYLKQLSD